MPRQKNTDKADARKQPGKTHSSTAQSAAKATQTSRATKTAPSRSAIQSLLIKSHKSKKLSPGQLKFNRLVKQIEGLQQSMEAQTRELDAMQAYYLKEVVPYLPKENEIQINYIKTLFSFYKRKRKELTKDEHEQLGGLLEEAYEAAALTDIESDPELMAIHKKIYRQSYEASLADDLELLKIQTIDYLFMNGIEVDEDAFEQAGSFEAVQAAVINIISEFEKRQSDEKKDPVDNFSFQHSGSDSQKEGRPPQKQPKKTAAQLKKEQRKNEKEALKQKSISTIYKQLAKLFHPDLEPDADKRTGKEALMQQLTRAYKEKDLHTLLQLELGWIQQEENNIQQLADDKLALYVEILQEQARELKTQKEALKWHPQYSQMLDFSEAWTPSLSALKASFRELKTKTEHRQHQITQLKKNDIKSIKLLKNIIREYMIEMTYMDDDFDDEDDDYYYETLFGEDSYMEDDEDAAEDLPF